MTQSPRSVAGKLLYRHLPEEYRYRDNGEDDKLGDLEAYFHGYGEFLDQIRNTLEQIYADAFAEPVSLHGSQMKGADASAGFTELEAQGWIAPYIADLIGATLTGPSDDVRRGELDHAVTWFKSKGTLGAVDSIGDVLLASQAVLVEDWPMIAVCPRISSPNSIPLEAENLNAELGVTPDFNQPSRAILDEGALNPLFRLNSNPDDSNDVDSYWKPINPIGAPWFQNSYQDTSRKTPDLRFPEKHYVGPHPRRAHLYVAPPWGLFRPGDPEVAWPSWNTIVQANDDLEAIDNARNILPDFLDGPVESGLRRIIITPELLEVAISNTLDVTGSRLRLSGSLSIPSGFDVRFHRILALEDVNVTSGSIVRLEDCAVGELLPGTNGQTKEIVYARHCLFKRLGGVLSFVQLEYCTVVDRSDVNRMNASDCIFVGETPSANCVSDGPEDRSCIRYSRLQLDDGICARLPTNTSQLVRFAKYFFQDGAKCVSRVANFGEPGCGVLSDLCALEISDGSEQGGEMGAHHAQGHAAKLAATSAKLTDFLPAGFELTIQYDPHLTLKLPVPRP